MKIGIVQSLVGGGGGNDAVLFNLLQSLEGHEITIYTVTKPLIELNEFTVKTILPVKVPFLGLYQNLLSYRLPDEIRNLDVVFILSGNRILHKTDTKVIYYNQNNFGDVPSSSKYDRGFWKLYYLPYKKMLPKLFEKIKKANIDFVSCSKYSSYKLYDQTGIGSKIIYPPVNLKEFKSNKKQRQAVSISRISPEKNLIFFVKSRHPIIIAGARQNKAYYDLLSGMSNSNIQIHCDLPRKDLLTLYANSKVYVHAGIETFGITTIEAMASGCIPIVPNNSAHLETVPFDELRYNSFGEFETKVNDALDGKYDYLLPEIKEHIKKFDSAIFQTRMYQLMETKNELAG